MSAPYKATTFISPQDSKPVMDYIEQTSAC